MSASSSYRSVGRSIRYSGRHSHQYEAADVVAQMSDLSATNMKASNGGGGALALTVGIRQLLNNELYSDLTIECGGESFHVHKAILHAQSEWFRTALSGEFQERTLSTLVFDHDDPAVVRTLLHYLYTFVYEDSHRGATPKAEFAVKVYGSADKYSVLSLRDLAVTRFT
ncbi:hypothetical protein LTR53_017415 [Teratosphaeriaceae sp. CCFEE 6253]|nr:hypothetical protein LTR53_017415 [Teratosphaeriaceae sp. CCFEE 6253]